MAGDQEQAYREATIDELAARIESQKRKVAVLVGAGLSLTAGIPLGSDIAEEASRKYPEQTRGCDPRDYAAVMDRLVPAERNDIFEPYIRSAKINPAHLHLADLVREGVIDVVLTTNFDPLAIQGLMYANVTHYIYDVTNLVKFEVSLVRTPAVMYLHGQFGAFVNIHSDEEAKRVRVRVQQTYDNFLGNHMLIVVGYGGDPSDPVFDELRERQQFNCGLYWVGRTEDEPRKLVLDGLLQDRTRYAYFLRGFDADTFFSRLAGRLEVRSRNLIHHPFTFLSDALDRVTEVRTEPEGSDLTAVAKKQAATAKSCFEEGKLCDQAESRVVSESIVRRAAVARLEQRYQELDGIAKEAAEHHADEAFIHLASAYSDWSMRTLRLPLMLVEGNLDSHLAAIFERQTRSSELRRPDAATMLRWAGGLWQLARNLAGKDAATVKDRAVEQYLRAGKLAANDLAALRKVITSLTQVGGSVTDAAAERIHRSIAELCGQVLALDSGDDSARRTWALSLLYLSHKAEAAERTELLDRAEQLLRESRIDEDYNLACVAAMRGDADRAFDLLRKALGKVPQLLGHARKDADLEGLRGDKRWLELVGSQDAQPSSEA